jgi:glycosyltransferase involved in cell wall biosynthesis
MESMEFGLPTIAWNIPGCDELVTPGENGALFEFGDVTAAANEIERLLEDQNAYFEISSAASRRFKEKHDIADYAPRIMRIYQKALARKARG